MTKSIRSGCGGGVDHETGEAVAFWFGTREHKNPDKLLKLLEPLKLGKVYTDGNYAYYERFSPEVLTVTKKNTQKIERKHEDLVCPAGKEGYSFFKNGTYAQDRGLPGNKCLVLWETRFDTMILEHYPENGRFPPLVAQKTSVAALYVRECKT
jgi:hypothetical protein